jgi:hypothetical protein
MAPHVYHRRVPVEDFPDAVDDLAEGLDFVLFESVSQADIEDYRKPDPCWIRGRAFGEDKEVRWQRQGESCDLHLLTENEIQHVVTTSVVLEDWDELEDLNLDEESEPTEILLWGTWNKDKGAWIETRIPRPLIYPIKSKPEHVRILALNYKRNGVTVLTRLREVVSDDGEETIHPG